MNLLARVNLSTHLIFSTPSLLGKHLCYFRPLTALQQCSLYSTKTTQTSLKTQQFTKPKTLKSSDSSSSFKPKTLKSSDSSSSFSRKIEKRTEALTTVWPKPTEIPYQAKVANFVNLIGRVTVPVQFEFDSDGKHLAATVISLGNVGERNSLLIPVVFEGDLAHVVACHVKEDDCVFVSGQLSADPMRLVLSESLGKSHVVAENLNFVQGFEKSVLDKKVEVSFSALETDKLGESAPQSATLEVENVELSPEKVDNKSGESVNKKKDAEEIWDLWRDLVKNPLQWWDYRGHKANGLVKEKFPDFKQKGTGDSLWLGNAPKWVLPGLGKLKFDVKELNPKQVEGGGGPSDRSHSVKLEDSWKNLVENPDKWWDNRAKKRNLKAPDFRHKETGEALWLNNSPAWALSKLPPMKDHQNTT